MALITCPECDRQVSDRAGACPQCGAPVHLPAKRARSNRLALVAVSAALVVMVGVLLTVSLGNQWAENDAVAERHAETLKTLRGQ
ncbi:putative paraquat-inducible protein A [Rhodobium orientis]|uniref:zinc-ribbon domain-containing protein n=1 Tax=Rhodobium orientis TaxID=34017 RepID=UPI001618407B|nr:zinc-ribbon domain-containing protein [Rhodobium orientis]MBB4302332.1 putative paraquat-inducible protein A [Rhodobium orientis]